MYAIMCTRPNITYAVSVISRFLSIPVKEHWATVKWIFKYLKGTSKPCICFRNNETILVGYAYADMAGMLKWSISILKRGLVKDNS